MLSANAFMSGMEMLKKCFIGWQFDTNDEMQVKLWFSAFKNTTDDQFISIVKEYIAKNDHPPKAIKNLTDILVDKVVEQAKIPPEKAFNFVREIISDCGGWEFGGKKEIYKKLTAYPSLYKTVEEFEYTLKSMAANDPYVGDRFRKAYERRLRDHATTRIDNLLGLKVPDNSKALGAAALPYET